jgi:hypothetical protein
MIATESRRTATKPARKSAARVSSCKDSITELIQKSYAAFAELYEAGDYAKFSWLPSQLDKVEQMADSMPEEKLHEWLSSLYKRYRTAKKGQGVAA